MFSTWHKHLIISVFFYVLPTTVIEKIGPKMNNQQQFMKGEGKIGAHSD